MMTASYTSRILAAELALGSDIEKYIWHLLEPLNSAINFDLNINRFEVGKNRSITIDPPE